MSNEMKSKLIAEYKLIRDITTSSRMKTYVAKGKDGEFFRATWLNREKLLARYEFLIHNEDETLPLEEVREKASAKYSEASEKFKTVFERTKGLSCPFAAETYDLIRDDKLDIDVMISEYVSGQSIVDTTYGLTPLQAIPLFVRAFEAIKFQHENGLLNLNIKTSSFWVNLECEEPIIKLMNYGFAIPKDEYNGEFKGTAMFMAPEVALGQKDKIDERADLYSMGVLMYLCLARNYPFKAREAGKHSLDKLLKQISKEGKPAELKNYRDDIPDGLESLIFTLLESDPDKREEFNTAFKVINYCYEMWPKASKELLAEHTITSSDFLKDKDEEVDELSVDE